MGTSREMNTLLLARQEGGGTGREMNTLLLTRQAWGSGNWQRDEHVTVNKTGMGEWELAER